MVRTFSYNKQAKVFKQGNSTPSNSKFGNLLTVMGVSALMNLIPVVIKIATRRYGSKKKDEILQSRNDRINRLSDNYKSGGLAPQTDKDSEAKYREEIHALYEETLSLAKFKYSDKKDGDLYIQVNQDKHGGVKSVGKSPVDKDTILEQYINPFLVVLRMILVNQVHILAGTTMGADRRNFELVFDPDHTNVEDVQRSPFRTVIFKYPWPSHGFEVTTRGQQEANKFINDTIDFLAKNPKYLSIRVGTSTKQFSSESDIKRADDYHVRRILAEDEDIKKRPDHHRARYKSDGGFGGALLGGLAGATLGSAVGRSDKGMLIGGIAGALGGRYCGRKQGERNFDRRLTAASMDRKLRESNIRDAQALKRLQRDKEESNARREYYRTGATKNIHDINRDRYHDGKYHTYY